MNSKHTRYISICVYGHCVFLYLLMPVYVYDPVEPYLENVNGQHVWIIMMNKDMFCQDNLLFFSFSPITCVKK